MNFLITFFLLVLFFGIVLPAWNDAKSRTRVDKKAERIAMWRKEHGLDPL